jgi:hypothetical protein
MLSHSGCVQLHVLLLPCALAACGLDSEQAERVTVPIVVDGTGTGDFTNAEGYTIHFTTFRVAFDNVELTTGGEMHASLVRSLHDFFVPTAYAHPGHYAGGEITGEMDGRFVVDWLQDGASLGDATVLEGDYEGANFVFTIAKEGDVTPDDPLLGHTMQIEGTATKDGETWTFRGFIDEEDGKRVVGLPIGDEYEGDAATPHLEVRAGDDLELGLQLIMVDPLEMDTAFDNLDFAAMDDDGDGECVFAAGEIPYNLLVKQLQVHDQYWVTVR